jgi:predicted glycoside hydrolase/deacetylase ChbG (UPF0249 family)
LILEETLRVRRASKVIRTAFARGFVPQTASDSSRLQMRISSPVFAHALHCAVSHNQSGSTYVHTSPANINKILRRCSFKFLEKIELEYEMLMDNERYRKLKLSTNYKSPLYFIDEQGQVSLVHVSHF